MFQKIKDCAGKAWGFVMDRAKELSSHFAGIEAAAILAIQQSNGMSGNAAKAMFALVFIQALTPDYRKNPG